MLVCEGERPTDGDEQQPPVGGHEHTIVSCADPGRHVDHVLVVVDEFVEPVDQRARFLDRAAVRPRPPQGRAPPGQPQLEPARPIVSALRAAASISSANRRSLRSSRRGKVTSSRQVGPAILKVSSRRCKRPATALSSIHALISGVCWSVPADRAQPVGVEDHLVAIGGQRLRAPGRQQLTLGKLDRTIVRILGMPQCPLGGGDLVVLLAHQLPQRPSGDFDGLTLALSEAAMRSTLALGLASREHKCSAPPQERNVRVTAAAKGARSVSC